MNDIIQCYIKEDTVTETYNTSTVPQQVTDYEPITDDE